MTQSPTAVTLRRWRTRRSAAVAGIVFAVVLITAFVLLRQTISDVDAAQLADDPQRRRLIRLGLQLVPFAGIAFLWFIGVIRDQIGQVEDRLFSTVFLGSGLLFVALLFIGAVASTTLIDLVAHGQLGTGVWDFGRGTTRILVSVYAMRMAAVFTLSVSTLALRTGALPRWMAWLGYLVALMLLLVATDNAWVQLAFPAWVLLLSITLLVTSPHQAAEGP